MVINGSDCRPGETTWDCCVWGLKSIPSESPDKEYMQAVTKSFIPGWNFRVSRKKSSVEADQVLSSACPKIAARCMLFAGTLGVVLRKQIKGSDSSLYPTSVSIVPFIMMGQSPGLLLHATDETYNFRVGFGDKLADPVCVESPLETTPQ